MMSLRRIFGLMMLFLFFEAIVAVVTKLFWENTSVLMACLAMTGLAVATWAVFFLIAKLVSRQKAAAPAQKPFVPAPARTATVDDSFTLEFNALIREANQRLEALISADGQKVAPSVATLPMYLVIGAEGSGKTTAIVNSGLEPRLLAGEATADGLVVPTRLANMWFAEGAIFVELSGRLVMQEPDRWQKALHVLRQERRQSWWKRLLYGNPTGSNLKGVLLACDTEMFLRTNDVQRLGSIARTLNERLQAVQSVMRPDFPTYVLLTHCDSVRYFQEFFAQLSDAEGRRILGVTFPFSVPTNETAEVYSERESSRIGKYFNRIYQSLADKRIGFMAREELVDKRALGYEFPRELKKLRGEIVQFLLDVFRPVTLHRPCRLRGMYLTGRRMIPRSAAAIMNDSSTIDFSSVRRPSEATAYFGSARNSSNLDRSVLAKKSSDMMISRWTFLTDVFRNVILTDPAGRLAPASVQVRESKYVSIGLGAVGVICLVFCMIWVNSWHENHKLLTEAQRAVDRTQSAPTQTSVNYLPDLENLRPVLSRLRDYNSGQSPLSYHWGLYTGHSADNELSALYFDRFRKAILEPTLDGMKARFLTLEASSPISDDVYKELKAYRIITSGSCPVDEGTVSSMMLPFWISAVSRDAETNGVAETQIEFYSSQLKRSDPYGRRIPENSEAVSRAQVYLRDLKGADQILQALLVQVRQDHQAVNLSTYAANYSQVLTGPDQMDAPYTRDGWKSVEDSIQNHKLSSTGEACVVGGNSGVAGWTGDAAMDTEVQKRYSDSYGLQWKQYLEAHHVTPFGNPQDGAQKLRTLADNSRSPLLALIYITSANTNVEVPKTLGQRATDNAQAAAAKAKSAIQAAFGQTGGGAAAPAAATTTPQGDVAPTVLSDFGPARTIVDPTKPDTWVNDNNKPYVKALGDLSDALLLLPPKVHSDQPTEVQALQQAKAALSNADAALHTLKGLFPRTQSRVDVDLGALLQEPIDMARKVVGSVPQVGPTPAPPVGPAPVDHAAIDKIKQSIKQVNMSAQSVCSAASSVQGKYPFDTNATDESSVADLNQLLAPGTGAYSQFALSPDASRDYQHQGKAWQGKPDFPATYSEPFLATLNTLSEMEDELYAGGNASPTLNYTLSFDTTGKIPFELDIDGHVVKYSPGHPLPTLHLVWPPVTSSPTKLTVKDGSKNKKSGGNVAQWNGIWGVLHLLQAADQQSGNTFVYRTVQFAKQLNPLVDDKGNQGTIQIHVDSTASNFFNRGYFAKMRCTSTWAMQPQGLPN